MVSCTIPLFYSPNRQGQRVVNMIHSAGKVTIYLDRVGRDHSSNKRVIKKLINRIYNSKDLKEFKQINIQQIDYSIYDCGEWLG